MRVTVPGDRLKMPPPAPVAEFVVTGLLTSVSGPPLEIPPPWPGGFGGGPPGICVVPVALFRVTGLLINVAVPDGPAGGLKQLVSPPPCIAVLLRIGLLNIVNVPQLSTPPPPALAELFSTGVLLSVA